MRILGVDTGISRCGWAITDSPTTLVECGMFVTEPSKDFPTMNAETIARMREMAPLIDRALKEHEPDAIIVETVPPNRMAKRDQVFAVQVMFRMIGMSYKYAEMAAVTSKKRFTGDGRAKKADMKAECIRRFPNLAGRKFTWDTYDAVAISVNAHSLLPGDWWTPLEGMNNDSA